MRSAGRAAGSRGEEPLDTAAESADVGAHLAGGSATGDISGEGAVDAHRDEVVPFGFVKDVGLAQFAEAAEGLACFELVDDVAVSGAWEVVEFRDEFFARPDWSARCCRSDAA